GAVPEHRGRAGHRGHPDDPRGLRHGHLHDRPLRCAAHLVRRVERRQPGQRVRHHGLPGLDARAHREHRGRGRRGPVGRGRGPGRRRQLGRVVPRRPDAERAPGGGGRTGQVPHLPGGPAGRLGGGQHPALLAGGAGVARGHRVHPALLQRRPGRRDLRRHRDGAGAGLLRPGHPGGRRRVPRRAGIGRAGAGHRRRGMGDRGRRERAGRRMTAPTRAPRDARRGAGHGTGRGPDRAARLRATLDTKAAPYAFITPFFLLFGVFGLFPLLYTVWVSLHDWSLIGGNEGFVGLDNYAVLLGDAKFWNALLNTLGIFAIAVVPQLLAALLLADALNRIVRGRGLLQITLIIPYVTSIAAMAIVFSTLFGTEYGMINQVLGLFGIDPVNWRGGRLSSWTAIAVMVDWRWTGYNTLIYLAAMQAVPKDLYEAAALDGASALRRFW